MNSQPKFDVLRAMRLSVFPSIFACLLLACGGDGKDQENNNPTSSESKSSFKHQENVFAASENWYVNAWWADKVKREGADAIAQHSTAVWLSSVADIEDIAAGEIPNIPNLEDGTSPKEGAGLRSHLTEAEKQGNALVQLVFYDAPGRDCSAVLSQGELPASDYGMEVYRRHFIDRTVSILRQYPHVPVAAIIEPNSLVGLISAAEHEACMEVDNARSYGYTNVIRYAINQLSALEHVHIYLDVGSANILGWDNVLNISSLFVHGLLTGFAGLEEQVKVYADNLKASVFLDNQYDGVFRLFVEPPAAVGAEPPGYGRIDGFISNVREYVPLEEPYLDDSSESVGSNPLRSHYFFNWNPRFGEWRFGRDWLMALQQHGGDVEGLGMLIDTSRNGWGQSMAALDGVEPTQDPQLVNEYRIDQRDHRRNWCNQTGAGLGARPQASPDGIEWIDAYLWVKPPGESDGISYGEDDPRWAADPSDHNRKHEPSCYPDELSVFGQSSEITDDFDLGTGAMPNAPRPTQWFAEGLHSLMNNAWPKICEGHGDACE